MSGIVLRGYQEEFVDAVLRGVDRGVKRQLAISPTGSGKTLCFSEVIRRRSDKPTLILAHRDELLKQARQKLIDVAPELAMSIGLVKAGSNDVGAPVVIASIQTLARESRRKQLPPHFGTVIVDECHHLAADSYQAVLDHLDAELVLGVTATAERADGKELEDYFDEIVFARSIEWMVRNGYLCPPRGKRISLDFDLSKVKKSHGDFQADALADALEGADAPDQVLASYREHGEDRKTLIFTPNVAMAHHMATVFRDDGIAAEAVDGTTPDGERQAILHRFHTGETKVLSNCALLVEGYDEPSVECIILAAPTKSRVKYTQIIGRGLRLYPGKKDCVVLDVVGASEDNSIASLPALFGLRDLLDGESVTEARERQEREDREAAEREAGRRQAEIDAGERRRKAESIEFFGRDRMNWTIVDGRWAIALNRTETIILWPGAGEQFDVLLANPQKMVTIGGERHKGSFRYIARGLDLGYAQGSAEETVRTKGNRSLVDAKAGWREDRVSPAQRSLLVSIGLPVPATKGEANDLLDRAALHELIGRIDATLAARGAATPRPEEVAA
jgi:ATP-dependent helicase IRC3